MILFIDVFPSYILRKILRGPIEKMKAMIYQSSEKAIEKGSTFYHSHFKTPGVAVASGAAAPSVEFTEDYGTTLLSAPVIAQ